MTKINHGLKDWQITMLEHKSTMLIKSIEFYSWCLTPEDKYRDCDIIDSNCMEGLDEWFQCDLCYDKDNDQYLQFETLEDLIKHFKTKHFARCSREQSVGMPVECPCIERCFE